MIKSLFSWLTLLFACGLISTALPVRANQYYVSTNGLNVHPYTNWVNAATNLPDAVKAVTAGSIGTVIVDRGHFYSTNAVVVNGKTVVITSLYGAAETIIDGGGLEMIGAWKEGFYIISTAMVYGITITNFAMRGVRLTDSANAVCKLNDCVISGNRTTAYGIAGGGIVLNTGSLWMTNCVVRGNYNSRNNSYGGGGIYYDAHSYARKLQVDNSLICDNYCTSNGYGAGVFLGATNWVIRNSTISNNITGGPGGGLSIIAPGLLSNCKVLYNSTTNSSGGGVYITASAGTIIENCLIAHNLTTTNIGGVGGGICMSAGNLVRNCTIVSNIASRSGGVRGTTADAGILNSVVYFNTANHPDYLYTSNYYDSTERIGWTNSVTAPNPGTWGKGDCSTANPMLDNFRPVTGSLCINAGLYESWMDGAKDLDGRPRVDLFSGVPDIGAYEHVFHGTMIRLR